MNTARTLTIVLPFAPEEREAYERLVAAACALHAQGGWGALQVLQLLPAAGTVPALVAGEVLHWWEIESPHAVADAEPETLARLARAALAAPALADAAPRLIVWPAGAAAEQAAALLAADLGAVMLGRCSELAALGTAVGARRAAFGGRVDVHLRADAAVCCAAWRPQGTVPRLDPVAPARLHGLALHVEAAPAGDVELLHSADGQARLDGAGLVVSGGRGMAGSEGFELLGRIAGSLGAALGGSLPAVDAGWVPVARQVGQSGKFVSPRLYFAVGISGTPQHLAGVAGSSRIVAVNLDADAPIFAVADVGVVGDWRELLPLLAQRLEAGVVAD